jgi:hypothetical protein
MDLLYSILKITSLIATAVFGALGLLTQYKDDQGKITRWGRTAIAGILLSSGFSLGLYILETSKAKAAAEKAKSEAEATSEVLKNILSKAQTTAAGLEQTLDQQRRNLERSDYIAVGMEDSLAAQRLVLSGNKTILSGVTNSVKKQGELLTLNTGTLNEVTRGLYPIKDVTIGYWISVPTDHVQLKSYIDRFDRELTALLPRLTFDTRISWIRGGTGEEGGGRRYQSFDFAADAPLAPSRTSERLAFTILGYSEVELEFFKQPIDPSIYRETGAFRTSRITPDLRLSVSGGFSSGLSGEHLIEYNVKSRQFRLIAHKLTSDAQYWDSTGKILGIPDLLGAQMIVRLPSIVVSGDPTLDVYLPEIRRGFELETLIISLSGGRQFRFRRDMFQKYTGERDLPIYSFTFPKTSDELRRMLER